MNICIGSMVFVQCVRYGRIGKGGHYTCMILVKTERETTYPLSTPRLQPDLKYITEGYREPRSKDDGKYTGK